MNIEQLLKEGYIRLISGRAPKPASGGLTEEDIASFLMDSLDGQEKKKVVCHMMSCDKTQDVPEELIAEIKKLIPQAVSADILEAVVEFGKDVIRVVRTTGSIVTPDFVARAVPVAVFRDTEKGLAERSVTISKVADSFIVDIKIERTKEGLADLTVFLKDKKTKKPSSENRLSLVCGSKEIGSSLTEEGRVVFDNIELKDYKISLIRRGEAICLAEVFMKALDR